MKSLVLLDIPAYLIILIVVGAAIVAALLFILLHFTLFSSLRYKKAVRELNRRFEYLHALLFGQDSQYIKRIEIISLTNLLYVNTLTTFTKRFKDVRDKSDASAQTAINQLKDLLAERNWKALKARIPEVREVIENYDEEVNALNNDLLTIIQPEEECRQQSLLLKEELRKIKQDYYVKQADLILVSDSFDQMFKQLDQQFQVFEDHIESAHYEEAKAMLPNIAAVIREFGKCLQELPNICAAITTLIPEKLASLESSYEEMRKADYPLHHLLVRGNIEDMNMRLTIITQKVKNFDLRGVAEELDSILARIDEYFDAFDKEKDARLIFDRECDPIYAEDTAIEKKYIRLCNALPEVKKIYVIPSDEQTKIDTIKNLINKAGATKRSLDTFIHSGKTKQPYTLLVDKMHTLRDEADQASTAIDDFDRYLMSLKADTEAALEAVENYYKKLHIAEVELADIGIEGVSKKYEDTIEGLYQIINMIFNAIQTLPIDVGAVNALVAKLVQEGDALAANIHSDSEQAALADRALVYANRDRWRMGELNDSLRQVETFYFAGDFKRAYDETLATLRRIRGE